MAGSGAGGIVSRRAARLPVMRRAAVPLAVLLLPTALGASASADVRVLGGHAYGLEDTPPHAWLAGGL